MLLVQAHNLILTQLLASKDPQWKYGRHFLEMCEEMGIDIFTMETLEFIDKHENSYIEHCKQRWKSKATQKNAYFYVACIKEWPQFHEEK